MHTKSVCIGCVHRCFQPDEIWWAPFPFFFPPFTTSSPSDFYQLSQTAVKVAIHPCGFLRGRKWAASSLVNRLSVVHWNWTEAKSGITWKRFISWTHRVQRVGCQWTNDDKQSQQFSSCLHPSWIELIWIRWTGNCTNSLKLSEFAFTNDLAKLNRQTLQPIVGSIFMLEKALGCNVLDQNLIPSLLGMSVDVHSSESLTESFNTLCLLNEL